MKNRKDYFLPVSILIAALLIGGAIVYNAGQTPSNGGDVADSQNPVEIIQPVTNDDHIRGASEPAITIVEYSDFECPFCKNFHSTMIQIMENYGDDVAWVYRQFPIESLHTKAMEESIASECAAELGGDDAFWAYADMIFEETTSNDGLDLNRLPDFAENIGLDRAEFQACLDSGDMVERIEQDLDDARALSDLNVRQTGRGIGTPHSILINNETGEGTTIPGALPYDAIRPLIDSILQG
ncbi:MAG: thioredoxin domain-containing protein [Candidatus Paceibacterota bacterium]